jgi:hypothetical protein
VTATSAIADRIKSRATATTMSCEGKDMTPIPGVYRIVYISLSSHAHVWQSTTDERRAVVVGAGASTARDSAMAGKP